MPVHNLQQQLGNIDIYLLDQILKERFTHCQSIFDAGCGSGRNLHWFYQNSFKIYGIDQNIERIDAIKKLFTNQKEHFCVQKLSELTFNDNSFHHSICNAVLHFAFSKKHFLKMFSELVRVTKNEGIIFIRMTSNFGIKKHITYLADGKYKLPDGTHRFLLTKKLVKSVVNHHPIQFIEPIKTVNVNNQRSMTTLVFKKVLM
ncbi:MAG TPA: class I SAM-dependent methyltransferase [Saprospiraceae bacterium]|nr:class I SAM-dependent methyltransferase [Saprospiraceae bacterium]